MKLFVLCSADSWYHRDLVRAASTVDQVVAADHRQLSSNLTDAGWEFLAGGYNLREFDAVLLRTMPVGSLEQVVFRMDVLGRLAAAGQLVVNAPKTIECAVDKYLSSTRLVQAGLTLPPTRVCQGVDEGMEAFHALGGDVVIKPIFGGEGRGLCRVSDTDLAYRALKMLVQNSAVLYLQAFIPHHGHDVRLFVLGDQVLGMKRVNATDWRTNVSRGAHTEPLRVDDRHREIALTAAAAVEGAIVGVDLLPGIDGHDYLLEVNAVPGWKALARTLDVDVGRLVLDHLTHRIRDREVMPCQ